MRPLFLQLKEGLRQFAGAKLRTFLALLGVLVGSASVVAMLLGGQLATHQALREFQSLGTDLMAVSLNEAGTDTGMPSNNTKLMLSDALSLAEVPGVKRVAPYTESYQSITYQGQSMDGMVLGVTNEFQPMIGLHLAAGRAITLADRYAFYCVIGHGLYEVMKRYSLKDPIGQILQIGNNSFVIVGVAEPWAENNFVYANVDNSVLIPILASMAINQRTAINNIIFRLDAGAAIPTVQASISRRIDGAVSDKLLNFRSAKELIEKMRHQSAIYTVLLGLIGSISLLVGGIGLMNVQLLIVSERRMEIGLRRALGATPNDILFLFLMESSLLSGCGGILGVVLGMVIAMLIAFLAHWSWLPLSQCWLAPCLGLGVALVVGLVSGVYPAYLASRLSPMDGLRSV